MTEMVTAPERSKAPPRSLWADAWRRLLKNRFAVASLVWLVVIGLAALLAPLIVPFDPQHQELWAGRRAPLYQHPTLELNMRFAVGSPPPLPFPRSGDHVVEVEKDDVHVRDLRVPIGKDGKIERIELGPDYDVAEPREDTPSRLVLGTNEHIVLGEGAQRISIDEIELEVEKPAPPVLGAGKPGEERIIVGQWRRGEQRHTISAKVERGELTSLAVDGKPEEQLTLTAEDVVAARVDGAPFTHRHLLGLDDSGRDILSRVIFGGRISLMVGIVATLVSLVIGVAYGAFSGYAGGRVDEVMMRVVDILYAIPFMFFVIILLVLFGRSLILLFAAIGAVEWLTMARIVRGQVLSLKEKEFIEAARVSGTSTLGIVFGHLVPNSLGSVIVYTTLTIPEVILTEAFLSFLGLSVQYNGQNLESWGSLTESGMHLALGGFPWLLIWSATALSLTLFALNFLGDGLRDALDPRLRGKG